MQPERPDADADSTFTRIARAVRHPLRAVAMAVGAFCLVADVAMTGGIVAAVLGCLAGIAVGEWSGRSRVRLPVVLGGLAATGLVGLGAAWALVRLEFLVSAMGTGAALEVAAFVGYGGAAFATAGALRALGRRKPAWVALEVGALVAAVAVALAAHRGGAIARPLWLSDLAWRRGIDPAHALVAIGLVAAMIAVALMLLERKGRLRLASLAWIPLFAWIAVSCFSYTQEEPERGDASPETGEGHGQPTDTEGDHGPGGRDDGGTSRDGGEAPGDAGAAPDAGDDEGPSGPDGGLDGGAGAGDGGLDGGASAGDGGLDGGVSAGDGGLDGGAGGGGADGGLDGSAGGGGADGGLDGSAGGGGADGGLDGSAGGGGADGGLDGGAGGGASPPPRDTRDDATREGGAVTPQDLQNQPPQRGGGAGSPVAVVLFDADYSPPAEMYYFRQDAWSELSGRRLVPATRPGVDRDILRRFPTGRDEIEAPPPEFGRTGVMTTVALTITHPAPFGLESPAWLAEAHNPNPSRFRRAYRVFSRAQSADYAAFVGHGAGDPTWSDEVRATYLELHPDPRFQAFADEVVESLGDAQRADPFARAVAIKLRLDTMLTYSTAERHAESQDPAADFFFGNRTGYCVHFSHTAVFLYRAAGVPARIGVGYASEEANRRGGSALVLQSGDAHAWPEVYVEGAGWIVLDIAAARNLDPPRPPQDEDAQQMLGEMAREEPPDPEDELDETPPPDRRALGRALLGALLAALAAVLAGLYGWKLWRRVAPYVVGRAAGPRAHHRASLDRLAEIGVRRAFGETREQFAERAATVSPSFAAQTARLLEARFGAPDAEAAGAAYDPRAWADTTAAVRREVNAATPALRRWRGRLNPLSFLDSR